MSGKGTTLKGITVEIGGDTTKLGDAIRKARKSAKDLSGELRGVESLLKLDPTNTVLLAQKQDILAESIAGAKDKLKMLIAAQESMSKQLADGKISTVILNERLSRRASSSRGWRQLPPARTTPSLMSVTQPEMPAKRPKKPPADGPS